MCLALGKAARFSVSFGCLYIRTVCIYICIYIRICIYIYIHIHICIYIFIHIYKNVFIHVVYVNVCVYSIALTKICEYMTLYMYMCLCVHIYIHTLLCIYIHTHISIFLKKDSKGESFSCSYPHLFLIVEMDYIYIISSNLFYLIQMYLCKNSFYRRTVGRKLI